MTNGVLKGLLLASASLAASLATSVQAQTGPIEVPTTTGDPSGAAVAAPPTGGVEDIVVTAQRREESLQTVPIAVTALSAGRIADAGIREGRDLERFVPSLKMTPNITSPTNLSPSLRGSTTQDAALFVAESPFGIYIDDVFVGRLNGNNTTLNDIERVEVLRGPQGTLYGRNTLAGAIKYITRTPGKEDSWAEAQVGYGNYDQYIAAASVGGALSDDVGASGSFQFNGRNGYGRNIATGERYGNEDNFAGRVKLRYTGIQNLDLTAAVSYADSRNDAISLVPGTTPGVPADRQFGSKDVVPTVGFYSVNIPSRPNGPGPVRDETYGKTKQTIASLTAAYDFGDVVLKSISAYVRTKDAFNSDFSGAGTIYIGSDAKADQYTQELQLQGTLLDDKLNFLVGGFYLHEKTGQDFGFFFFTPASQTFARSKTDSIAGFGQVTYEIVDNLAITAGIRYTRDKKAFDMSFLPEPTILIPPGPQPPVALDVSYDDWTPKFAVDYEVPTSGAIDRLLIYASASKGFRSGGFNGIAIFNLNDSRSAYFPETNWTYEGGFKTDLIDRRLRVNAAYFVNRISDLLLNATVIDPATGAASFPVQNAGSATIKGLEVEVTAVPFDGLNLYANGAFLKGKFRSLAPGSAPTSAPALYGVDPQTPQTPDYTITLGFDYTAEFPIGSRTGKLRFGSDYYRSDDYILTATNDFRVDAYDRFNAFVALEYDERIEARLAVKNIENDKSFITGSRPLGGYVALPPRTFMVTLGYKM